MHLRIQLEVPVHLKVRFQQIHTFVLNVEKDTVLDLIWLAIGKHIDLHVTKNPEFVLIAIKFTCLHLLTLCILGPILLVAHARIVVSAFHDPGYFKDISEPTLGRDLFLVRSARNRLQINRTFVHIYRHIRTLSHMLAPGVEKPLL